MFKPLTGLLSLTFSLVLLSGPAKAADAIEFIVLGDIPYGKDQFKSLEFIGENIDPDRYPLVVHYGDVKGGESPCEDSDLRERKKAIYGLHAGHVFYTPGDNDWTDCDRPEAGGHDELKRLDNLREIFFQDEDLPSEPAWHIARQTPGYPENARWLLKGIHFVTLHVVGSDNGRHKIEKSDKEEALRRVAKRDEANLKWLKAAFDGARDQNAQALVVFMHADPFELEHPEHKTNPKLRNQPCNTQERTACNPYLTLLKRLTSLADAFGKPVLLVHGSTNRFCLDTGFGGWRARKLWRLNGPGDFVTVDAAVVRFEPGARVPFQVRGLLSGDTPTDCWR